MDPDPHLSTTKLAHKAHKDAAARLLGGLEALDEIRGYLESSMGHVSPGEDSPNDHMLLLAEELLVLAQKEQKLGVDLSHCSPSDFLLISKAALSL